MSVEPPGESRLGRRKARTRQALVDAAVLLIADGRGDRASIQEITEAADIGFGSFYNHFESKEQLFEVASEETLERWGTDDRPCHGGTSATPPRSSPSRYDFPADWAGPIRTSPDSLPVAASGYLTRRAAWHPEPPVTSRNGQAAGRFSFPDTRVALSAVAGGLIGLLRLREQEAEGIDESAVDLLTEACLRLLGVRATEARRLAAPSTPDRRSLVVVRQVVVSVRTSSPGPTSGRRPGPRPTGSRAEGCRTGRGRSWRRPSSR